jgi:hypothetical protein
MVLLLCHNLGLCVSLLSIGLESAIIQTRCQPTQWHTPYHNAFRFIPL